MLCFSHADISSLLSPWNSLLLKRCKFVGTETKEEKEALEDKGDILPNLQSRQVGERLPCQSVSCIPSLRTIPKTNQRQSLSTLSSRECAAIIQYTVHRFFIAIAVFMLFLSKKPRRVGSFILLCKEIGKKKGKRKERENFLLAGSS